MDSSPGALQPNHLNQATQATGYKISILSILFKFPGISLRVGTAHPTNCAFVNIQSWAVCPPIQTGFSWDLADTMIKASIQFSKTHKNHILPGNLNRILFWEGVLAVS